MTDNVAILEGFTSEVYGEYNGNSFTLLVKPNTDLESLFKAWSMDNQEFVMVRGWLADLNYC